MDIFQEGNSKGAGSLHMPEDELMEKKTSLVEQRLLAGTLGEKKSLSSLEEGADNLQGCW